MLETVEVNDENKNVIINDELMKAQKDDKNISPVYKVVETGIKLKSKELKEMNRESKILMRQLNNLSI